MVDKNGKHIPTRYLGAKFLERLDHTALDTIEEAARNKYAQDERGWARWKNGVQDLLDTLHELEGFTPQHSAAAILSVVAKLIVDSWIDSEYGLESDSSDGARDDMAIVLAMAEKFTIEQFLLYVNALQATKDVKPENLTDYVLLGTIYRFKGLERPTVFIIGASQLILPHRFSLGFPVPTDGLAVSSTSTVWDERNLTFVGVTRAKDCCIISGVRQWPSIKQELEPSQFIFEMGLIERDHAQETVKEAIEVSA
jgi:superfamily I DNA/RNA helicase